MKDKNPLRAESDVTNRGFGIVRFQDDYDCKCSLQESSSCEPHVWLGIADANPQVMASKAAMLGVETTETNGWVPYPIPDEVLLKTRMHLNEEQAIQLAKMLLKWAKKGKVK